MIKVIKSVKVYCPKYVGVKDVVVAADKIEGIYDEVKISESFINVEVINGEGKILTPGFIDSHVHITGGGGEGGFNTRTPNIKLSDIINGGVTTIVGVTGTDGVTRNIISLLPEVYSLEEQGITAFCYTASYDVPVLKTLTGTVKKDIMLVQKIIGVGELALCDHRGSQPTFDEFLSVVAEARVGGLLSGKAGIVNIHLGDGKDKLNYLFKLAEESEIPVEQLLPTHINRTGSLLKDGLKYTRIGGNIDLTTSANIDCLDEDEYRAGVGIKFLLDNAVPIEQITFSSDGNGSMPVFNEKKELIGLEVCSVGTLFREVKYAISIGVPFEDAIKVVTSNVARILHLKDKGEISPGKDADLLLIDEEKLEIEWVIAKGKVLMENGKQTVKGNFE
ncbi:MAG: beta-aspartyl-peptidase [Sarcina sp.]